MIGALPWAGDKPVEILWVRSTDDAVVNVCCRPPDEEGGADAAAFRQLERNSQSQVVVLMGVS